MLYLTTEVHNTSLLHYVGSSSFKSKEQPHLFNVTNLDLEVLGLSPLSSTQDDDTLKLSVDW